MFGWQGTEAGRNPGPRDEWSQSQGGRTEVRWVRRPEGELGAWRKLDKHTDTQCEARGKGRGGQRPALQRLKAGSKGKRKEK